MEKPRHERKEYYSVLVVSNLDRGSRQFRIARKRLHLLFWLVLILFLILCGLIYWAVFSGRQMITIQGRLAELEKNTENLEAEKNALISENQELIIELASLGEELKQEQDKVQETGGTAEAEKKSKVPELYPSSGVGSLTATYTEEHPYISISTYHGGDIIAAGNGVVTSVSSDQNYKYIIEIEHEDGYKTRYLYKANAELKTEEGAQVKGGDILLKVTEDGKDLDYQVLYQDEPIDPFSVIDAEG